MNESREKVQAGSDMLRALYKSADENAVGPGSNGMSWTIVSAVYTSARILNDSLGEIVALLEAKK